MENTKNRLLELVIFCRVALEGIIALLIIRRDSKKVSEVQESQLLRIIKANKNTVFGKKHNFASIRTVEDYREHVRIQEYETLRPYVEAQDQSDQNHLLAEPIIYYSCTSGTTGKPKLLPVTKRALNSQKRVQHFFVFNMLKQRPRMFRGKILSIVSPSVEGFVEGSGKALGSTSGHFYESIPKLVKSKYVLPSQIFEIDDYDLKYLCIARLAIQERDISMMITSNPSTWARMIEVINKNASTLIEDLAVGRFSRLNELPVYQQRVLMKCLKPDPVRAEELKFLFQRNGAWRYQDLWRGIESVACWTGGSCSIFLDKLKGQFSEKTNMQDIGYLASEFRGTIPVSYNKNGGIPTFRSHFLEFALQSDWDDGERSLFYNLNELQVGKKYYIFITTAAGLYRYNMNDVIEVTDFYHQLPLIRFVQKGKGVTNITGEKLYESQMIEAINFAQNALDLRSTFFVGVADENASRYLVYIEDVEAINRFEGSKVFVNRVEEKLKEINIEYAAKRESGRLKRLEVIPLRSGAYELYKKRMVEGGQREGQFKVVAIQYKKDLPDGFENLVEKIQIRGNMEKQL